MSCCCKKTWCVGVALLTCGLAGTGAWALLRNQPEPAVERSALESVKHARPPQVLAATLERLHQEALAHFHADPQNGLRRMPPVYHKVVKEWKMPWYSSGELDHEEAIPFPKDMQRIHEASLKDFLASDAKVETTKQQPLAIVFDETKYDRKRKLFEAKSVDLIGLIKKAEPVVYVSEKVAAMASQDEAPTRPLDEFEFAGLQALQKGDNLFGRSRDGVIRLLGSVRAEASCVSCHAGKQEGDLLGAFSYVLREAEYKNVPFGSRPVQPKPVTQP